MAIIHDTDPRSIGRLTCGSLRATDVGDRVELQGWVNRRRDLGGLIFIDLRDRYGLTQVVFNPELNAAAHEAAGELRNEFVLKMSGKVRRRPAGTENANLTSGEIEILCHDIAVLNAGTIPDRGLYGVFLAAEPGATGLRVGELDEEMVFESRPGEIFLLGASSWRIDDITHDRVLVTPAPGEPGKLPFWHGDRPGRAPERITE